MPFIGVKLDPDNPFDRVVFAEESLFQDGFNEGFARGIKNAEVDGYKVGLMHGKELSREIGFYKGFVSMLSILIDSSTKGRQRKLLEQLNKLLNDYSYSEHEFDDMHDKLDRIRSKFKQLSSIFKMPTEVIKHGVGMSF